MLGGVVDGKVEDGDGEVEQFPGSFTTPDGKGLGGATCCPEFKSLVANSLTSLDAISLGKEEGLNAIQHFVVDETQAANVSQSHPLVPSETDLPPGWRVFDTSIEHKKPHVKKRVSAGLSPNCGAVHLRLAFTF